MSSSPYPLPGVSDETYRRMFALEDTHWWFHGMEAIATALLDAAPLPPPAECRALDAGCGTGRNLRFLRRYSAHVTGVDYSANALQLCATRANLGGQLARGSINALPFRAASFDLITCADVLSHSAVDERRALTALARVLRPGGSLFLRVAAYDWLRGRHDMAWSIAHRYRRPELRKKLRAAGFEIQRISYANTWLLPFAVAKRLAERWSADSGGQPDDDLHAGAGNSLLGQIFRRVLASEAGFVARFPGGLPCGLSLVALARKLR